MKMTKQELIRRVEKIIPTLPIENKEYKDEVFLIELPEGGDGSELKIKNFSGFAVTGDIAPTNPVRFYAKVVGFEDVNASKRDWGMNLDKFRTRIWRKFQS